MSTSPAAVRACYPLETKPDAAEAYRRFDAWWQDEIIDRAPVTISVRGDAPPVLPPSHHASFRERWYDTEYRLACHAARVAARPWLAETFPVFGPELGPDVMATLYGCELEFADSTSWSHPVVDSCRDLLTRQPDLDCPAWQWVRDATDRSLELGRGRWITAVTDLHSSGDLLAAVRGAQDLLVEMADDPDAVGAAMRHITPDFQRCFDDLASRIRAAGQPVMSWTHVPVHGRGLVLQCDLICMMGPKAFRSLVLPAIRAETETLERSIFHLDGPTALRHLDDLLTLPRLNAIQWIYGAGNGPAHRWIEVYRKVLASRRSVQVCCEDLADAEQIMQALKPAGVWLSIGGEYPRDVAEAFLARVARWSHSG